MFAYRKNCACLSAVIVGALTIAVFFVPICRAEGNAVSGPNGKFSVEGGEYDSEDSFLALGSFTIPVTKAFGLQLDGAGGYIDSEELWGGGGHFFTRDPSRYLLGAYGSFHEWNDIQIWRAAVESEFYFDKFSFTGLAGYENVNVPEFDSGLQVVNEDDAHFFGHFDLAYYPIDDLKLYGGYRYISEVSLGAVGAEYLLRDFGTPVSLFVNGNFGDGDHTRITGGARVYLGEDSSKSLITRHRTEDPQNYTPIFPNIRTRPREVTTNDDDSNLCTTASGPLSIVTGPGAAATTGDCICPSGTTFAGGSPAYNPDFFRYECSAFD